jgi:hypothetical protein
MRDAAKEVVRPAKARYFNKWQHQVGIQKHIGQEPRQVLFDNGARLIASFHSEALLQTLWNAATPRNMQEPDHSTLHPLSSCFQQDARHIKGTNRLSSIDHVSVLMIRKSVTHI